MKVIEGDLVNITLKGEFDVIAHGCNCFRTMKAGIAKQMSEIFQCHKFPMEVDPLGYGNMEKLGAIDYKPMHIREDGIAEFQHEPQSLKQSLNPRRWVYVVNAYTQYRPGADLSYAALELCLKKINYRFSNKILGIPLIGGGIAGGDLEKIAEMILKNLTDVEATLVLYDKNNNNDEIKSIFSETAKRLQNSQQVHKKKQGIQAPSEESSRQGDLFDFRV